MPQPDVFYNRMQHQIRRRELGLRHSIRPSWRPPSRTNQGRAPASRQQQVRQEREGRQHNRGVRRHRRGNLRGRIVNNRFVSY